MEQLIMYRWPVDPNYGQFFRSALSIRPPKRG